MLYERAALSKKPDTMVAKELATMCDARRSSPSLVMRDPYIPVIHGLRDICQEGDLKAVIIRKIESFPLKRGVGFTFCLPPEVHPDRRTRFSP